MSQLISSGIVISINNLIAKIQMKRTGACSGEHEGCPWNAFAENILKDEIFIDAKNLINAKPGDKVEVAINSKYFKKAIFLVYIFPLIGLFTGLFLGILLASLFNLVKYSSISGIMFMILGLLTCIFVIKRISSNYKPDYKIIQILDSDIEIRCIDYCGQGNICK